MEVALCFFFHPHIAVIYSVTIAADMMYRKFRTVYHSDSGFNGGYASSLYAWQLVTLYAVIASDIHTCLNTDDIMLSGDGRVDGGTMRIEYSSPTWLLR